MKGNIRFSLPQGSKVTLSIDETGRHRHGIRNRFLTVKKVAVALGLAATVQFQGCAVAPIVAAPAAFQVAQSAYQTAAGFTPAAVDVASLRGLLPKNEMRMLEQLLRTAKSRGLEAEVVELRNTGNFVIQPRTNLVPGGMDNPKVQKDFIDMQYRLARLGLALKVEHPSALKKIGEGLGIGLRNVGNTMKASADAMKRALHRQNRRAAEETHHGPSLR